MFHLSFIKEGWIHRKSGEPLAWIEDQKIYDLSGKYIMYIEEDKYVHNVTDGACQYYIDDGWIYSI